MGKRVQEKYKYIETDVRSWGLTSLECTCIQIETDTRPISLVSAYRNPREPSNIDFTTDLDKICTNLNQTGPFILGGDLNAHNNIWKDDNNCKHGKLLVDWLRTSASPLYDVKIEYPQEPTFYRGSSRNRTLIYFK